MNSLKLFSYHVVLFVVLYRGCHCQRNYIRMNMSEVQITDNIDTSRNAILRSQVLIKISENQDEYFFLNDEMARICGQTVGQTFTSDDIEVRSVFKRTLSFSFIKAPKNLTLYCQFATNKDLQLFFSQLRKPFFLEDPISVNVRKMILFDINGAGAGEPIANNSVFYRSRISKAKKVRAADSYNFVRLYPRRDEATDSVIQTQEADLVFVSQTFNITGVIGDDKVGICLLSIPPGSIIILRFASASQASSFARTVERDTNALINCSVSDDWLAERRQYIDAPEPFNLPDLPYLR